MITRYISLAILLFITIMLGIVFFQIMMPFLLPLFLASVVALVSNPIYQYFLQRTKQRTALAAGLTTTALVAAVIVPLFIGVTLGALQLYTAAEYGLSSYKIQQWIEDIQQGTVYRSLATQVERIAPTTLDHPDITPEVREELRKEIIDRRAEEIHDGLQSALKRIAIVTFSPGTAKTTFDFVAKAGWSLMSLATFIIALYYFYAEGPTLIEHTIKLIPVNIDHQKTLVDEFSKAIRAVVTATFLAAFAQGLATSIALWFLGFGHFFLFTIIATLSALIPLAGTWLVWLPCAIALAYQGSWIWAILLCIYGFGFIGTLDNVIRAYVLHSDAKLHPLLAFVSVLGGLQVMGLWGVFIAPIIACCLHALVNILNEEFVELSKASTNEKPAETTPKPA